MWTVKDGGQPSTPSLTAMRSTLLHQSKAPSQSTDDSLVANQPLAHAGRRVKAIKPMAAASSSCSNDRDEEWLPKGGAARATLADHYAQLLKRHGPMTSQELFALSTDITRSAQAVTNCLSRRSDIFSSDRLMHVPGRPSHTWFLKSDDQMGASSYTEVHATSLNQPRMPALSTSDSLVSSTPLAQASRHVTVIKPTAAASSSYSESEDGKWRPCSHSKTRNSSDSRARQVTHSRATQSRCADRLDQVVKLIQQHGPMTSQDLLKQLKGETISTEALTHFLTGRPDIFGSERPPSKLPGKCPHIWHVKGDSQTGGPHLAGTRSTLSNLRAATTSSTCDVSSTASAPSNRLSVDVEVAELMDDSARTSTPRVHYTPKPGALYQQGTFGGRATHLMPRVWTPQLSLSEPTRTVSTRRTDVTLLPANGHVGGKRTRDNSALSDVQAPPRKRPSQALSGLSTGQPIYSYLDELGQWQTRAPTPAVQNSSMVTIPGVEQTIAAPASEWVCGEPDSLFPELNLS
ncbi:MAG: hypothetical protein ACOYKZ_05290 [Chlamydiia bacterium]